MDIFSKGFRDVEYDPRGIEFMDTTRNRLCRFITEGEWKGWICYKQPMGPWTLMRRATEIDKQLILSSGASMAERWRGSCAAHPEIGPDDPRRFTNDILLLKPEGQLTENRNEATEL